MAPKRPAAAPADQTTPEARPRRTTTGAGLLLMLCAKALSIAQRCSSRIKGIAEHTASLFALLRSTLALGAGELIWLVVSAEVTASPERRGISDAMMRIYLTRLPEPRRALAPPCTRWTTHAHNVL